VGVAIWHAWVGDAGKLVSVVTTLLGRGHSWWFVGKCVSNRTMGWCSGHEVVD
jgi:hypothetical protein